MISGVAFPEKDSAVCASFKSSGMPIAVPSAVFLEMASARLVSGGMQSRMACGKTT